MNLWMNFTVFSFPKDHSLLYNRALSVIRGAVFIKSLCTVYLVDFWVFYFLTAVFVYICTCNQRGSETDLPAQLVASLFYFNIFSPPFSWLLIFSVWT